MQPVRTSNIGGLCVERSYSLVRFKANFIPEHLAHKIRSLGGEVEKLSKFSNQGFSISHRDLDSYGALYLLNQWEGLNQLAPIETQRFDYQGFENRYSTKQAITQLRSKHSRTSFQRLIESLLPIISKYGFKSVALPIRIEEVEAMDLDSAFKNSFIIVPFSLTDLADLVTKDRQEWRVALLEKAKKIHQLLSKRTSFAKPLLNTVLLSNIGNISSIPWIDNLRGDEFMMLATPIQACSANLFFWKGSFSEAMTSSVYKNSNFADFLDKAELAWRSFK